METQIVDPLVATNAAASQGDATTALGKEDFMRLLVAKLENQDPLNPADDTQFISELATFSSLEQLINVNDNLLGLAASQTQLINSQALDLIGKEALVEAGDTVRIKNGQPDTLVYTVPEPAREATLQIVGPDGAVVRTFQLNTTPEGPVTIDWDGSDESGEMLEDGDYSLRINGTDASGDPMTVPLFRSLPIDGVSFFDGAILLFSDDQQISLDQILEFRAGQG